MQFTRQAQTVLTRLRATDYLIRAYLFTGAAGLGCCLLMHYCGTNDPRTPITIEYKLGNPLATIFFVSALISALLVAWLFHRGNAKTETLLLVFASACIGLLMVTPPDSAVHTIALAATVCVVTLVPITYVLRSEFSLKSVILLALSLSLTFVSALATLSPDGMGLGIAERLWFGVSYIVNATIIEMLIEDGSIQ